MFVRFRQSGRRLQVSLVETRRVGGKIAHDHIGGLGSIGVPQSPADRIEFWTKLHQRLAALANRIHGETHGKVLGSIHARIPMPTQDDQRTVQLENAKEDAQFWDALRDLQVSEIEDRKGAVSAMQRSIAEREPAAADAAAKANAAQERLQRVERGEAVGGVSKPGSLKDLVAAIGWKPSDARHARRLAAIGEIEGAWPELIADVGKRQRQAEKAASRAILSKRRRVTA